VVMSEPVVPRALLELLVCPICRQPLEPGSRLNKDGQVRHEWLHCQACSLYYPIQDGIPVMLAERATREPANSIP
jgi:uncharacterized protein YbaR (Trm112 family)